MTPTGKFAPPTVDETRGPNGARTSGRRSIDGVPHFYKRADRRWYPVDTSPPPPQGHVQFPSQQPPPPQRPASPTLTEGTSFTPATQPPPPDSSEQTRSLELALLNTNRSISQALSGLVDQFTTP